MRLDDDHYLEQVSELVGVIHKHGCPTFMQFYHRGPWLQPYAPHRPRYAASAVPPVQSEFDLPNAGAPRAPSVSEIQNLTTLFSGLAARAKKAGFDGIELNAGGDHLFSTFLSRFTNKRRDEYGFESMEDRSRFLVGMIEAIKGACGDDFPVLVLINALEAGAGDEGMTFEESRELAVILQRAGADALHVRSHWYGHS